MKAPLFTPIDWVAIRDRLWDWFSVVTGCETIWSDENGPQPAYPYASLNILPGVLQSGALDEQRIQSDGSLLVVGRRDFVLSCQIHVGGDAATDPMADARIRADAAIASLSLPQFLEQLAEVNVGLRDRGQPQMIDVVVGPEWIKRVQVDVTFATVSEVDAGVWPDIGSIGWFDKVRMTSQISPLQGGGDLNWNDELLDPNA